jgi:hypothetical protein
MQSGNGPVRHSNAETSRVEPVHLGNSKVVEKCEFLISIWNACPSKIFRKFCND